MATCAPHVYPDDLTSCTADAGSLEAASGSAEGNAEYNDWLNMLLTGAVPCPRCSALSCHTLNFSDTPPAAMLHLCRLEKARLSLKPSV